MLSNKYAGLHDLLIDAWNLDLVHTSYHGIHAGLFLWDECTKN